MQARLKLLRLAVGLTLWLSCSASSQETTPCGDGFGFRGDAQICLDDHIFLKRALKNADGGELIGSGLVQKKFHNFEKLTAVALINEGQACAIKIHPEARSRYVENDLLNSRFIERGLDTIRDEILNIAQNDCVMELNYHASSNLGYMVVDFVEQPPFDGIPDGLIIIDDFNNNSHKVRNVLFLKHAMKERFPEFIWAHPAFGRLADVARTEEIIQLAPNGYVTKRRDSSFWATYIYDEADFGTYRVCSKDELVSKHRNPTGTMGELLKLSSLEIAERAIPNSWYQDLKIDPAAYVLCGE